LPLRPQIRPARQAFENINLNLEFQQAFQKYKDWWGLGPHRPHWRLKVPKHVYYLTITKNMKMFYCVTFLAPNCNKITDILRSFESRANYIHRTVYSNARLCNFMQQALICHMSSSHIFACAFLDLRIISIMIKN